MSTFKHHEEEAVRLLLSSTFAPQQIEAIISEAMESDYSFSGCGYFFSVSHPSFPMNRIVCSEPFVLGKAIGIDCTFLIFIQDGHLTLECATIGLDSIPSNFRNMDFDVWVQAP